MCGCVYFADDKCGNFEQLNGNRDINTPLVTGPKMRAALDIVIGLHEVMVMIRSMPRAMYDGGRIRVTNKSKR